MFARPVDVLEESGINAFFQPINRGGGLPWVLLYGKRSEKKV